MGAAAGKAIPAVLGIAGLMGGNKASGNAADAEAKQWELIQRQIKAFDMFQGVIQNADAGGAFDGNKRVEQIQKDQAQFEQRDLNNTAGAYRIAGYKPGDSPMQGGLDSVRVNYKTQFDRLANDARNQAVFDRINAYSGLNSASGSLGAGIASTGQQANYWRQQDSGTGALLNGIMPFLGGSKAPSNPAVGAAARTAASGAYALPRFRYTANG